MIQIPRRIFTSPLTNITIEPRSLLSPRTSNIDNDRLVQILRQVQRLFSSLQRRSRFRNIIACFFTWWGFLACLRSKCGKEVSAKKRQKRMLI